MMKTVMNRSAGVSLVEVLVSIVVLSIALLGAAGLMGSSLRSTNTAYYRSQATVLVDDMLDRMRANIEEARNQKYDIDPGPSYSASGGMARYDCEEWVEMLTSTFPDAVGVVDVNPAGVVTITITWGDGANSFTTETRL